MTEFVHCLPSDLEQLLTERMSAEREARIVEHLDACVRCREALEVLAGGPAWVRETRDTLCAVADTGETSRPFRDEDADGEPDGNPALPRMMLQCLAPSDDPAMLGRLGVYEVSGVVGAGGAGIVFKAHERSLNRIVAVKVLSPVLACNGAARKRFAREARAAAAVVHEHIVPIHAVDEFQGLPFLVMQYIPGRSLQQRLTQQGPLGVREILRIAHQTALGLAAAHSQGVVHRDIKPANILLENGVERVLLTDFGLARTVDDASLTCSGVIAGTPEYMSPEQAHGEPVDHRSDLFSLGSVMYAMCTGHSPFRASTTMGILRRICQDRPRPIHELNPEIPGEIGHYIERLLDKRVARRPQTAQEVAQWCTARLADVQSPTVRRRWNRLSGQRRWFPLLACLLLVALGATFWNSGGSPATHRETAGNDGTRRNDERPISDMGPQTNLPLSADSGWPADSGEIEEIRAGVARLEQELRASPPSPPDRWSREVQAVWQALQPLEVENRPATPAVAP